MAPAHPTYDGIFMELMRNVIHHVADEETLLLPAADRLLAVRARALGAQFTKRKLQLKTRRLGEMVGNAVRATPTTMVAAAGAVFAGAYLLRRLWKR